MTYAISDLHGCYEKFTKLLDIIHFSDSDTLYILGDTVDRGPQGLRLILDFLNRSNLVVLRGNHDDTAYRLLGGLRQPLQPDTWEDALEAYRMWLSDGGAATYAEFQGLGGEEQEKVLHFLASLPFYTEIQVGGRQYFLAHTVPEKEVMQDFASCKPRDFIWGEPDYEEVYFPDKYLVTGHTPTGFIDRRWAGRIWQKNNHIAIDCGAVFGNPLGCICLDTLEEFYVR